MKPIYIKNYLNNEFADVLLNNLLISEIWVRPQYLREECFMRNKTFSQELKYQYISGGYVYTTIPYCLGVEKVEEKINHDFSYSMNICFLNKYIDHTKGINWHADDSQNINQSQPICVYSLGQSREIWFREKNKKGVVFPEERQLLEHNSLFIMPAGMQNTHLHKIPKGAKEMSTRISLTFRSWIKE